MITRCLPVPIMWVESGTHFDNSVIHELKRCPPYFRLQQEPPRSTTTTNNAQSTNTKRPFPSSTFGNGEKMATNSHFSDARGRSLACYSIFSLGRPRDLLISFLSFFCVFYFDSVAQLC